MVVNRWLVERWGVEKRVAKERKREEEPLFDFIRFNPALFIPLYFFLLSPFSFHAEEPSFCACGISFLLPDWLVAISSSSSSSFSRFIRRRRPQRGRRHRPRYLPDDGGEKVRTALWTHTLVYVSRPVETPGNCVSQCHSIVGYRFPNALPLRISLLLSLCPCFSSIYRCLNSPVVQLRDRISSKKL